MKSNILKLVYRINTILKVTGVENLKFVRDLKYKGKRFIMRVLAPNNLLLLKVNGLSMYIRTNTSAFSEYFLQPFEPYTTELFKKAIKPGARVIDIGAQFGYYSLLAAKQMGQAGEVYAFEPVPSNFELLTRNIKMNGYTNIIHRIQKAAGDKRREVSIFVYKDSDSHGMYPRPTAYVKEAISVECITIDEFFGGKPVDVIKMDIEGSEPYALEGMKQTITKNANLILFTEFAPAFLRLAGIKAEDYLKQLESLGFHVQLIDEHSRCLSPVIKEKDEPFWYANLYCTKGRF